MGRHFLHRGDTNEAKWSDTQKKLPQHYSPKIPFFSAQMSFKISEL